MPLPARLVVPLLAILLAPVAQAQYTMPPENLEWAITDGVPFELDDPSVRAAMEAVQGDISGQNIHDCIEEITMDVPYSYRVMGTPTQAEFVERYKGVFSDMGLPSGLHVFPDGGPGLIDPPEQLQGGVNIVGVLPGLDNSKWVVLGGHYDTRELTMGGGALDNASGICTVKELARSMKAYVDANGPLEASVVFLWYDGEEWGLFGAIAFANDPTVAAGLLQLNGTPDILVSQSYDMAGLNYPAKNMWVEYGDPNVVDEYAVLNLRTAPIHDGEDWTCWSYGCYEELKGHPSFDSILANNTHYQFLVREIAYDQLLCPPIYCWVYDDHYGRSDHIPLIAKGAAGMRIQGSHDKEYPHYHQPTDSLPGLYALTGGEAPLVAGFEMEAEAGGLAAFYTALNGNVGGYGYLYDANLTKAPEEEAVSSDAADEESPGPGLVLLSLGILGLALVLRRRV